MSGIQIGYRRGLSAQVPQFPSGNSFTTIRPGPPAGMSLYLAAMSTPALRRSTEDDDSASTITACPLSNSSRSPSMATSMVQGRSGCGSKRTTYRTQTVRQPITVAMTPAIAIRGSQFSLDRTINDRSEGSGLAASGQRDVDSDIGSWFARVQSDSLRTGPDLTVRREARPRRPSRCRGPESGYWTWKV